MKATTPTPGTTNAVIVQPIKWQRKRTQFGPDPLHGYVGKVKVFSISMSMSRRGVYDLRVNLPGIKTDFSGESEAVCKNRADACLARFLELIAGR